MQIGNMLASYPPVLQLTTVRPVIAYVGERQYEQRTPAMAAGLADHVWTTREWVTYPSIKIKRD